MFRILLDRSSGNTASGSATVTVPHGATPKAIAAGAVPDALALMKNHPNPFNPSTIISYRIPEDGHIRLCVFDHLGREMAILADLWMEKGMHQAEFTARDEPSGLYFYRLEWNGQVLTRKMMLVK